MSAFPQPSASIWHVRGEQGEQGALTIHIPKVNNNWVYDEVKESAGA
jgi:hypothetical protein